jgi:hypothetical protein
VAIRRRVLLWTTSIYLLLFAIIGTGDSEELFNGAYSYAANNNPDKLFATAPTFGKHTLLGVPIYDTTIGTGYRLPLLYSTSHSPFVFLRNLLTTQMIQFFTLGVAAFVVGFAIQKFLEGINPVKSKPIQKLLYFGFYSAIIGPTFSYLYTNDWSTQATQYLGAVVIFLKLIDRSWFDQDSVEPLSTFHIPAGLAFGIVCFALGHPGNIPNYLIPIAVMFTCVLSRNRIRLKHIPVFVLLACIAIASFAPTVLGIITELAKQPYPRIVASSWMSSQSGQTVRVTIEILTAVFWPLLSILGFGKSIFVENAANGFSGLLISVLAVGAIKKIWGCRKRSPAILVLTFVLICSITQMIFQRHLGFFQPSASWQLRDPLIAITSIFAVVAVSEFDSSTKERGTKRMRNGVMLGLLISSLFPIATLLGHVQDEGVANGFLTRWMKGGNSEWVQKMKEAGVHSGDRVYIAHPDLFRDAQWYGFRNQPQLNQLSVSTINGWPKMRSSFTLVSGNQRRRFVNLIDSSHGCQTNTLGFLAVDWVLDQSDNCLIEYQEFYGIDAIEIFSLGTNESVAGNSEVSLYRIGKKEIFTATELSEANAINVCPIMSSGNCFSSNSYSIFGRQLGSFKLCPERCVAVLSVPSTESLRIVVIPLDFDKSLEVRNPVDNTKLETKSQNGFLAVEIEQSTEYVRTLEVVINPDLHMWINALSPWAVMLILTALFSYLALAQKRE